MNLFSSKTEEPTRPGTLDFLEEGARRKHFPGPVGAPRIDVYAVLADAIRLLVHRDGLEYADQTESASLKFRGEQPQSLLLETLTADYLNR